MNDQIDTTQTQPVIEADIVAEPSTTTSVPTDVSILFNLEAMIKSHITGLDDRKSKLKNYKEMMTSAFKNDPSYQEAEVAVKEATKLKKEAKARLMKLPEVSNVQQKVTEFASEIKEMDEALSDYLREYQRLSGSNEIILDNGEVHEITYVAKLLKRSSKNR